MWATKVFTWIFRILTFQICCPSAPPTISWREQWSCGSSWSWKIWWWRNVGSHGNLLKEWLKKFKFRGKDCNNRPAPMRSKVMKVKKSRRIIGTFAEVSCLVRSFSQMAYDNIQDFTDPYWQWLLSIRKYLRYILMPKITDQQVLCSFLPILLFSQNLHCSNLLKSYSNKFCKTWIFSKSDLIWIF